MKIAVIGSGVTGLTAAYELQKRCQHVVVFDVLEQVGGIAGGYKIDDWDWFLDYHYHHIFTSDKDIKHWLTELDLIKTKSAGANERDLVDQLLVKNPQTANYYQGEIARLDSPGALLKYPFMSLVSRLRTAAGMAFCKFWPWGQILEKLTAKSFIVTVMGQESWDKIWQPLFKGKFGDLADEVNAAWFWARIYTRSQKLVYAQGGFQHLFNHIQDKLEHYGVEFQLGTKIDKVEKKDNQWCVKGQKFDQVLFTGHSSALLNIYPDWATEFKQKLQQLETLAAMTLIMRFDESFLPDKIYWLNINEAGWPFSGVIEHTNFVSADHYAGQTLVYVANYLPADAAEFAYDKDQVLQWYDQYLNKLHPNYQDKMQSVKLFKTKHAQPIARCNHSQLVPKIVTPAENLFWAGMQHVYPYDRGTNYAVRLGRKAAGEMLNNNH